MNLLLNSNAPWAGSGYGQQADEFLPLFVKEGHKVAMTVNYGMEPGLPLEISGIKYYTRMGSIWGDDAMIYHGKDFNTDVTMTLQDIWTLQIETLKQLKRWVAIMPIDHDPIPPAIHERLRLAYRIIALSRFGQEAMRDVGLHSTYIPHSVNTDLFKPMDKGEMRKLFQIPQDKYIFGMVGANKDVPPRKGFQEAMDAFVEFLKFEPNSLLYLHVNVYHDQGFPIVNYAKFLGIGDKILFTPTYEIMYKYTKKEMGQLYNTFDCLLQPSTNGGFELPIIEAQATGVPVITTNFTAMPELVIPGKTGERIKVAHKRFTPILSYIGEPDTRDLLEKMRKVYKWDREKTSRDCVRHIKENYETQHVFNTYWKPWLGLVQKEVDATNPPELTTKK